MIGNIFSLLAKSNLSDCVLLRFWAEEQPTYDRLEIVRGTCSVTDAITATEQSRSNWDQIRLLIAQQGCEARYNPAD